MQKAPHFALVNRYVGAAAITRSAWRCGPGTRTSCLLSLAGGDQCPCGWCHSVDGCGHLRSHNSYHGCASPSQYLHAWPGPYVRHLGPAGSGHGQGKVAEQHQRITRSGLADLRLKFSVNLCGNPARTPREFAQVVRRRFLVGTSLTVQASTGQYDPTTLINLGTNRWALKPEVGISYPWKKYDLDLYGGAWCVGDNSRFYTGQSLRKRDPITTLQGARQLYDPATDVVRRRWYMVLGRRRLCERWSPQRQTEQHPLWSHAVASIEQTSVPESGVQRGGYGTHRVELRHHWCGLAVCVVWAATTSDLARKGQESSAA
jgi:hypothetical protein